MSISLMIAVIVLGGWASSRFFLSLRLPNIIGMLLWGILLAVFFSGRIPPSLWEIAPFFKSLSLIVILLRAGLGINRKMLQKNGLTAILMGFVPCLVEALGLCLALHMLLDFPYPIAIMTAFIIAAVSPAVVIPSMLEFNSRGHGAKKQIPALILAGASIDAVTAFTFFAIFLNMARTQHPDLLRNILSVPYAIIVGVLSGLLMGYGLVALFKSPKIHLRATEKVLVLIACCFFLLELGNLFQFAALLGTMTAGFVIYERQYQVAHELSAKLSKWWIIAEIILFVLIGMNVELKVMISAGGKGLLAILCGLAFRAIGVIIATAFSRLNRKEKLFCVIANVPKATVQAALGAVPLYLGIGLGHEILALAVLSIIVTAPLGVVLIEVFGKKLLKIELP